MGVEGSRLKTSPSYWKFLMWWTIAGLVVVCVRHGVPPGWGAMTELVLFMVVGPFVNLARNALSEHMRRNAAK